MQAELDALDSALGNPARPLVAVVGGAKISTKLELIGNLTRKVDTLIIGGGMANTFWLRKASRSAHLYAKRVCWIPHAPSPQRRRQTGAAFYYPGWRGSIGLCRGQTGAQVDIAHVPDDQMILDAGPQAVKDICSAFDDAQTLIWNGPLGAFEIAPLRGNICRRAPCGRTYQGWAV